jgi:hypothetical protein
MKSIYKQLAITLILAVIGISLAHAVVPEGKMVNPKISTKQAIVLGGSAFSAKWLAPAVAKYQVWVQVPRGSTASNAVYRIYPKGTSVSNIVCSSTDSTYPCFEATVDQMTAIKGWVQLTLNNDTNTAWDFNAFGFVTVNAGATSNTELLGVAQTRFVGVTPVETNPLAIGQAYQGGIIFYLDSAKAHGLIAAPADQSTGIQWYNGTYTVTGATGTAIGTGQANTNALITAQGAGSYAAKLCDDLVLGGYRDWFLPSKDELNELYKNKVVVGGFAGAWYWSSSEGSDGIAWSQDFGSGDQLYSYKGSTSTVRAVRDF